MAGEDRKNNNIERRVDDDGGSSIYIVYFVYSSVGGKKVEYSAMICNSIKSNEKKRKKPFLYVYTCQSSFDRRLSQYGSVHTYIRTENDIATSSVNFSSKSTRKSYILSEYNIVAARQKKKKNKNTKNKRASSSTIYRYVQW